MALHTGPAASPKLARDTETIQRLETEWEAMVDTWWFRRHLARWAADDPRLNFETGTELVRAAQRRDVPSWAVRDQPLSALLDLYPNDLLARRVALQIVLPGLKHLIDTVRGWDTEERASRVLATAVDVLGQCATTPAGTQPSYRVFANTRRRVMRAALKDRSIPESPSDQLSQWSEPEPVPADIDTVEGLVSWLADRWNLNEETARLIVHTRTGDMTVDEYAAAHNADARTIRQRRIRAERRLGDESISR